MTRGLTLGFPASVTTKSDITLNTDITSLDGVYSRTSFLRALILCVVRVAASASKNATIVSAVIGRRFLRVYVQKRAYFLAIVAYAPIVESANADEILSNRGDDIAVLLEGGRRRRRNFAWRSAAYVFKDAVCVMFIGVITFSLCRGIRIKVFNVIGGICFCRFCRRLTKPIIFQILVGATAAAESPPCPPRENASRCTEGVGTGCAAGHEIGYTRGLVLADSHR